MIQKRAAHSRAHIVRPFIDTRRTFSFPPYFDPKYQNYHDLQTINDDRVQHAWQVPWHQHRNMEIFGYVVQGSSHHVDSLGNDVEVPAGAVQRMSAGSGISHTEGNTSTQPNRYLQLWIRPQELDTPPRHDWHQFSRSDKLDKWCDITQKLPIRQDARFLAGIFTQDHQQDICADRCYYLYVVQGTARVNDFDLVEGDALMFEQEPRIQVSQPQQCEIILFDLAATTK
jgi:redox-sensitive bicupin YhaK (pirin superfamily)